MSSTRSFKNPGIFADAATTVIPPTPIAGVAYRDAVNGADDTPNGWRYGTRVASQDWNQVMFLLTSMMGMMDSQGVLGWSDQVEYAVPALVFGSDGLPYIALQASGPSTAAQDPVSAPTFWEQFALHGRVVLSSSQTWGVPLSMQLGYVRPIVTAIGGGGGGARDSGFAGGGGGGGGIASGVLDLTGTPTVSVTIGAAGSGAASGSGTAGGVAGGTTLFGALLSASGGGAGSTPSPGTGGIGTLGSLNSTLGPGGSGVTQASATTVYASGNGGGPGGSGFATNVRPIGENAKGPGGGGSGSGGAAPNQAGNGAAGIVIIEW